MSPAFNETQVWKAGDLGCECFYVYGLCRSSKTIHLFAEGRLERHDLSPHHIVHRRSDDDGQTWSETRIIAKSLNGECFANPTPVFDSKKNVIVLLFALNNKNLDSRVFCVRRFDNGESWSEPEDLTNLFNDDRFHRRFHLPGPGHGIEAPDGRLIFPVWHRHGIEKNIDDRQYGISFLFSDDGGETFANGGQIPPDEKRLNESRISMLRDGRLVLNARSGAFEAAPRYLSFSNDNGLTWTDPAKCDLPESFASDCGSIAAKDDILIFFGPAERIARRNLSAFYSIDKGVSWTRGATIFRGDVGYSDVVMLDKNKVGIVYGREKLDDRFGIEGNIRSTYFAQLDLDQIMEENDER